MATPCIPTGVRALLTLWLCLPLMVVACVRVQQPVHVTPGPVPESIRDARWQSLPIAYCTVPNDAGFTDYETFARLTAQAFEAWGVDVRDEGECMAQEYGNRVNEVAWGAAPESGGGIHEAGYTRAQYRQCPGGCPGGAETEIVEADILIHPSPPAARRNEGCLYTTLLHETGHFLGLPHLETPAVMAPVLGHCPEELTATDREAMRSLYPPPAP